MNRRCYRSLFVFCAVSLVAISCQPAPKEQSETKPPNRVSVDVPRDRYADDVARFLAGLPAKTGSPFSELEGQPEWVLHRRALDEAWDHIQNTSLPRMQAFQKQELDTAQITRATVFYPFSGPDALMLTVFFPANPTYVMVGLEPAGSMPTRKQLGRKDLDKY